MMTVRMRLNLTRTRLVLLAGRSLKMAALIVVERSPHTSSDCDYWSWRGAGTQMRGVLGVQAVVGPG